MAILSKDEALSILNTLIGERTDDEALKIIEDFTETIDNYISTNWEEKYKQLDEDWRKKYKERFFKGEEVQEPKPEKEAEVDTETNITIDDLFKKE